MSELSILKQQIADEFEITWRILGDTADRLDGRVDRVVEQLNQATQELKQLGADSSEGFRQVQGRMRLLEQRFATFVGALESETKTRLDDHELRLQRLEAPPAA